MVVAGLVNDPYCRVWAERAALGAGATVVDVIAMDDLPGVLLRR